MNTNLKELMLTARKEVSDYAILHHCNVLGLFDEAINIVTPIHNAILSGRENLSDELVTDVRVTFDNVVATVADLRMFVPELYHSAVSSVEKVLAAQGSSQSAEELVSEQVSAYQAHTIGYYGLNDCMAWVAALNTERGSDLGSQLRQLVRHLEYLRESANTEIFDSVSSYLPVLDMFNDI